MTSLAWIWVFVVAFAISMGSWVGYNHGKEQAAVKDIPSYVLHPDIGLGRQTFCIGCKPYETWRAD